MFSVAGRTVMARAISRRWMIRAGAQRQQAHRFPCRRDPKGNAVRIACAALSSEPPRFEPAVTTAFITHPSCLEHEMGPQHPECPERLTAIDDQLIMSGLAPYIARHDAPA